MSNNENLNPKSQNPESINPDDLQVKALNTKKLVDKAFDKTIGKEKMVVHPDVNPSVDELKKVKEEIQEILDEEDLNKKNYLKINSTLYIKSVKSEDEDEELFQILNPETNTVETRELTDEEKKELFVKELKEARRVFQPIKHPSKTVGIDTVTNFIGRTKKVKEKGIKTNLTVNQFGTKFKQKRKKKLKMTKISRKANR